MYSIFGVDEPHLYVAIGSSINNVDTRVQFQFYTAPASKVISRAASLSGTRFLVVRDVLWWIRRQLRMSWYFRPYRAHRERRRREYPSESLFRDDVASTSSHPLSNWPLSSEVDVVRSSNGSAESIIRSSGASDWVVPTRRVPSTTHPATVVLLAFGWIQEGLNALRSQLGWNGATTLPRELYVWQIYFESCKHEQRPFPEWPLDSRTKCRWPVEYDNACHGHCCICEQRHHYTTVLSIERDWRIHHTFLTAPMRASASYCVGAREERSRRPSFETTHFRSHSQSTCLAARPIVR
ncbi:hypothetical protein C8Q72DRAFT_470587 [Fomitopsis betulina]|nr:hypothetical protein C8Q72DRAFT_470587 [Fomitopsis betulina]